MVRVSAVIPVRNDADHLPSAVRSILDQTASDGVDLGEVLIVAGPSNDETEAVAAGLAAAHDLVTVIANHHGGIPQALNVGLAHASGQVLMRVDAHSVLPTGYLRRAVTSLESTGAGNVGAVQSPVGIGRRQRAIAAAMRHKLGSGAAAYREGAALCRVDTAFLGMFSIEALRSVGGWDETFARNEDAELNLRLRKAGFEVWLDPELVVEYRPRSSFRTLGSQYWHYGWWRARTIRRHRQMSVRQVVPPVAVVLLGASLAGAALVSPWLALAPAGYVVVLGAAAARTAGLSGPERLEMAIALAVMQLSWGTAFVASTLDPRSPASSDPAAAAPAATAR